MEKDFYKSMQLQDKGELIQSKKRAKKVKIGNSVEVLCCEDVEAL